jgi:hypothetical protein
MKNMKPVLSLVLALTFLLSCMTPISAVTTTEGNDSARSSEWLDMDLPENFAYSFAVIGDTQTLSDAHPEEFAGIYDFILDNLETHKIKFVMGLGDITDDYQSAKDEWKLARTHITRMNGKVRYSIVRGNHDDRTLFTQYFPRSEYEGIIGGSMASNMGNTWQTIQIGEVKYLILALDISMSQKVLDWASNIIASHKDHNVIITTHAYLNSKGDPLPEDNSLSPTRYASDISSPEFWETFVSQHENIVMVLCGHISCDRIVHNQREGKHGNIVTQMLIDPQTTDKTQGPCGLVAMLYFSADGKQVDVRYYSTARGQYFRTDNQFSLTLHTVDPNAPSGADTPDAPNTPDTPETDPNPAPTPEREFPVVIVIAGASALVVLGGGTTALLIARKKRKAH